MAHSWCVLRTKGQFTLPLAASLSEVGFDAWSPVEVQVTRETEHRSRVERLVAAMPTYVLAPLGQAGAILAERATGRHKRFSFMHYGEHALLVPDSQVAHLRKIEREAAARREPPNFLVGQTIRVPEGPFQGLGGTVVETKKGWVLVAFPGWAIPVDFHPWQIEPIGLDGAQAAAKAA